MSIPRTTIVIFLLAFITIFFVARPVYAVPVILPLLPFIGALVLKIVMVLSSMVFFSLAFIKKRKKLFFSLGLTIFSASIIILLFI